MAEEKKGCASASLVQKKVVPAVHQQTKKIHLR